MIQETAVPQGPKNPGEHARWVDNDAGWRSLEEALEGCSRIALDLESDGFHHYRARICLIQLAVGNKIFLVDSSDTRSLDPLLVVLEDPEVEVIMHSADYDIRSLDRDHGVRVRNLYDSSIAAAFAGFTSLGLGTVVEQTLGIQMGKSKRLQRFDWSRRPLPQEALDYAAGDVAYLFSLADLLKKQLEGLGRTGWVLEECSRLETVRYDVPTPATESWQRAKGVSALSPQGRAVFRELYVLREQLAEERDLPPFKILGNDVLARIAMEPEGDPAQVRGVSEGVMHRWGKAVREAVRRGLSAEPVTRIQRNGGPRFPRFSGPEKSRLALLKQWREERGKELALDPALLWPLRHLEILARDGGLERGFSGEVLQQSGVRSWQEEEFGHRLRGVVKSFGTEEVAP